MLDLVGKCSCIEQLGEDSSILLYQGKYDPHKVKISIVIPTYKRSTLLQETVNSCQPAYNHPDYEILIIFNARNEAQGILEHIKAKGIQNVRVYENVENVGMFQNWNQGIRLSEGKWVSIMHDDDMFEPLFFEMAPAILSAVGEKTAYINFNGRIVSEEKYEQTQGKQADVLCFREVKLRDVKVLGVSPFFATTCGTLVQRSAAVALGGFDAATYPSGDVLYPIKLINNGYQCYICHGKLNYYRCLANASLKKEVMDQFIYFYGQLQETIYKDVRGVSRLLYCRLAACLQFKSVWHVFLQADRQGVTLDSERPDSAISKTLKYRAMDFIQRSYWRLRPVAFKVKK